MSCNAKFPSFSLKCVLELVREIRTNGASKQAMLLGASLFGAITESMPDVAQAMPTALSDDLDEWTYSLENILRLLESSEAVNSQDADEKIIEIIAPILIPILFELWREIRRRRQENG